MQFQPQTVAANSWYAWAVEGLQLSVRRPLAFVVLTLLYAGLDYVPETLDGLQFWLTPLFLGLGCLMANSADTSRSLISLLGSLNRGALLRLVIAGVVPLLGLLLFIALLPQEPLPPVVFEGGLGILVMIFLWMLFTGPILWFMTPLVAVGGLPLKMAAQQGWGALQLNFFVYGLTMAVTMLSAMMILLGISIAAVLLYPVLSCMMYVGYRHIWLNRAQNEPEPIGASALNARAA